jgi:hypothetical protein
MNIEQTLRGAAVNGVITLDLAIKVTAHLETEREQTKELLKECERNVGMYLGEKINSHLAGMTGTYFNERDYHYERPVGEQ